MNLNDKINDKTKIMAVEGEIWIKGEKTYGKIIEENSSQIMEKNRKNYDYMI